MLPKRKSSARSNPSLTDPSIPTLCYSISPYLCYIPIDTFGKTALQLFADWLIADIGMMTRSEKIIFPLVSLIPWPVRNLLYRLPGVSSAARGILNRCLPDANHPLPARISAGPLKGFKIEVKFQSEKYFWLGTHEPPVQKVLQNLVKPGMTVYDVGAYIGFFTLLLSRVTGDSGQVIALEPNPETYRRLLRNLGLNHRENVQTLKMAAAESSGRELFQTAKHNLALEAHLVASASRPELDPAPRVVVETVALDDLVFGRGFPRPDLMKIDTEESEARVLAGMTRILAECRPAIVCETHSIDASRKVAEKLRRHSYALCVLGRDEPIREDWEPKPERLYIQATPQSRG
jgi:FkbM family methyltransferase